MKDTLSVCLKNKEKIKSVYNTCYFVCEVELRPSLARVHTHTHGVVKSEMGRSQESILVEEGQAFKLPASHRSKKTRCKQFQEAQFTPRHSLLGFSAVSGENKRKMLPLSF